MSAARVLWAPGYVRDPTVHQVVERLLPLLPDDTLTGIFLGCIGRDTWNDAHNAHVNQALHPGCVCIAPDWWEVIKNDQGRVKRLLIHEVAHLSADGHGQAWRDERQRLAHHV